MEEVFQALVPTLGHELWVMTERVRWWIHPAEMSFRVKLMLLCYEESQLGVWASDQDASLVRCFMSFWEETSRHTGEMVSLEKLEEVLLHPQPDPD